MTGRGRSLWQRVRSVSNIIASNIIASSINGDGRTGQVHAKKKNETGLPTYTIHQNKLKMEKKKT